MEKTFVLIKPDHVDLADEILEKLDGLIGEAGKRLLTTRVNGIPREVIAEHYSPHKNEDFFEPMVDYFTGKDVVLAIYEGDKIIEKVSKAVGKTNPAEAAEGTIRRNYSDDSYERADAENRPVRNVIHRSDSAAEVLRETEVWAKYLQPALISELISCLDNIKKKN